MQTGRKEKFSAHGRMDTTNWKMTSRVVRLIYNPVDGMNIAED